MVYQEPATCTQPEHNYYRCSNCGDSYDIYEGGYSHGETTTTTTEATCQQYAYEVVTCNVCAEELSRTQISDYADHDYETVLAYDATCVSNGLIVEQCRVCGNIGSETAIVAYGHNWVQSTEGTWYECSNGCGYTRDPNTGAITAP